MLRVHGVPGAFFVGLYLLFVRKLTLGGASNVPAAVTVQDVLAWGSGMPNASGHARGPDWYLAHSVIYPEWGDPSVPPAIQLRSGVYHLVRSFSHFGPSGFTWYLYRRR